MNIFKTVTLPYKNFFSDLKNNLNINILVSLFLYGSFLFYSWQVLDRIIGSGNKDTSLMLRVIVDIQQIVANFFLAFCLKKVYITTFNSKNFIFKTNLTPNAIDVPNRIFRLFVIIILIANILLTSLSIWTNLNLVWLKLGFILFPGYFVVFPAFALLERPQTPYIRTVLLINKELRNNKIKLIIITATTAAIFLFLQNIVSLILFGFMAYKIIQSNGHDLTTGMMLSIIALYDFITYYIGMIIYVKLSLILYSKLKSKNLLNDSQNLGTATPDIAVGKVL